MIVVGPPELHISAGIAAVESGRHVFVEKPPGNSLADAERLQSAARAAGKQVQIGFNKRRASAYRLAKQLTSEPEFGTVTSVDMTYAHWPVSDLRLHLVDMSIHALDTVRWLLGDPVRLTVYKRQIGDAPYAGADAGARADGRVPPRPLGISARRPGASGHHWRARPSSGWTVSSS